MTLFKTLHSGRQRGPFPESRASVPGSPIKSGDSKWAEFFAERLIYNVQQTVYKSSGAVHFSTPGPPYSCIRSAFMVCSEISAQEIEDLPVPGFRRVGGSAQQGDALS
jgi:hypothetical protein